jgi:hypothetical protein
MKIDDAMEVVRACRGPSYTHALKDHLDEWRKHLADVMTKLNSLERERDDLNKKIGAAEVLIGGDTAPI